MNIVSHFQQFNLCLFNEVLQIIENKQIKSFKHKHFASENID